MKSIVTKIIIVITALWLTGCAQTTVRHHQDFQEIAKTVESVVILPADVDVELIVFDGDNEKLPEKEEAIQREIHTLAANKLKAENLSVIEFDFKAEAAKDDEFAYALTQAKEAWDKSKEDMYKKGVVGEKDKAKFQTNLGSVLNIIADKTGAESVLLMHYSAFEKSQGVITKDIASSVLVGVLTLGAVIPIQATAGSFIDVALVETTSGKILWANRKVGAAANASPAEIALNELPDLVWETELLAEKAEQVSTDVEQLEQAKTGIEVAKPKAN